MYVCTSAMLPFSCPSPAPSVIADPHLGELLSARIDQCNVVVVFSPVHATEHWRR
ncbi:hypothetical protein ACGFWI_38210 [Streptomyces sp. NPDC048434]|uniref:hypothetical protein n=1 Tax=Streptomyces sp. NPDC048434 TaxID=3365549 RepID=UPI003720174F